jgi:imidazoleglycerol phosphate dehydratase HisB/histidinol-phosphate/aromatic aminotransferase/cobyric acid decarboxylase-like protein
MEHLAPFPALVPDGEGLNRPAGKPETLRRRMADLYGVPVACVLPVAGAEHGAALIEAALHAQRSASSQLPARPGAGRDPDPPQGGSAAVSTPAFAGASGRERIVASPAQPSGDLVKADRARETALERLLVVDESLLLDETDSLAPLAAETANLVVLRDLGFAYGLAGACVGAVIAKPDLIARLEPLVEPWALPAPSVRAAQAALSPSRALAVAERLALVKRERERLAEALRAAGHEVVEGAGPFLSVRPRDPVATERALSRFGAAFAVAGDHFRLDVGPPGVNDRALAALGAAFAKPRRRAEVVRDTKETRIAVAVDLDAAAPVRVQTGVGFFDHMLEQVASHGGFSLVVGCEGDLHIEAHHTVEDVMLAVGQALRQALADRRGIARFGFVLPMDEAEAKVSIDLGGRPYAVFEGDFRVPALGDYPTEMTGHCFRSLAETLGAAVHVSVTGENDHHKTEACFKALGRALRQAIRIEGDAVPSTKGVIA